MTRKLVLAIVVGVALAVAPAALANPQLVIPRLGINEQTNYRSADYGPYLWYRDKDTIAIAGHRVTHGRTFRHLDALRRGDHAWLGGHKYTLVREATYRPGDMRPLRWHGLILSACTPPGSASYRLVAFLKP